MATQLFLNLPVRDLEASKRFYGAIGYGFNPQFTDDKAACMVIGDDNFAMLLSVPFFESFLGGKPAGDARKAVGALYCVTVDSRDAVNAHVDKAVAAGGAEFGAAQDMGFMYYRSYQDLDGHVWEIMWMDPKGMSGDC